MSLSTFNELLTKEMTRKEFLLHLGLLALTITGIAGLLKTLSNPNLITNHTRLSSNLPARTGFGTGPYGA